MIAAIIGVGAWLLYAQASLFQIGAGLSPPSPRFSNCHCGNHGEAKKLHYSSVRRCGVGFLSRRRTVSFVLALRPSHASARNGETWVRRGLATVGFGKHSI